MNRHEEDLPPLTTNETLQLASTFCFIWFAANWTVNASLDYTSVASATIMSSMSGMDWLTLDGSIFLIDPFRFLHLGHWSDIQGGIVIGNKGRWCCDKVRRI